MEKLQKIVCFILMVLMVGSLCVGVCFKTVVSADASGDKEQFEELFKDGNMGYSATVSLGESKEGNYEHFQNKVCFNNITANSDNESKVTSSVQATVLLHGLGGGSYNWSNKRNFINLEDKKKFIFEYAEESIIDNLTNYYEDAVDLYLVQINKVIQEYEEVTYDKVNTALQIYKLREENYACNEANKVTLDDNTTILDTTKHNIFVFDIEDGSESLNNIYFLFNFAMSRIAVDMSNSNTGNKLPKFNLIGHSLGGVVNQMYAMDHPYMVNNLISIGTPYNGSSVAEVFGSLFFSGDALLDISDNSLNNDRKDRWNTNYDSLYSKINAFAIGSFSSIEFLEEVFSMPISKETLQGVERNIKKILSGIRENKGFWDSNFLGSRDIATTVIALGIKWNSITSIDSSEILVKIPEIWKDTSKMKQTLDYLYTYEIFRYNSELSFKSDVVVDLPSQIAGGYNGFKNKVKKFTNQSKVNFNAVSTYMPPVPHNLEARDSDIIKFVMSEISSDSKLYYKETATGGIKITGVKGKPTEVGISGSTWTIPSVIDGKAVTEIGEYAFSASTLAKADVTKVILPSSVKAINEFAFYGATGLTEVVIPEGVEEIGEEAFCECISLTKANIPSTVTKMGMSIFSMCSSLTNITISNGITSLPDGMFSHCAELTSITLPSSVTTLGEFVFGECSSLQMISFGGTIAKISNYAFYNCESLNISLQTGLLEIGDYAFAYCNSIPFTSLPNSVTRIGDGAFAGCSFTTFTLPRSLLSLGENIFMLCPNLTAIYVNSANTNFVSVNGVLYNYNKTELIAYPIAKTETSYIAPTSVVTVSGNTFINNQSLQSITLPNVTHIGDNAFACCSNLTEIIAPNVMAVSCNSFLETKWLTENSADRVVLGKAFLKYKGSASVVDLSEYVYIDDYAFVDNDSIEEVVLGEDIQIIGDGVFNGCLNFKKLTIYSNKVVSVTDDYFTSLGSDFEIFVPQSVINDYIASDYWTSTESVYNPISTNVKYYDGNTLVATQTVYFGHLFSHYNYSPSMAEVNGWKTSSDLSGEYFKERMAWDIKAPALNLYVDKTIYNCSVTYALNGGELPKAISYFNTGETFILPTPSRDGYSFNGWYLDSALTNKVETLSTNQSQNFNVFASWLSEYNHYYAELYSPIGNCNGIYAFVDGLIGSRLPSIDVNGVNFLGWFTSQTGGTQITDASGIVISNNFTSGSTLYAQFQSYVITYELAYGTNSSQNPTNYNFYTSTFILQPAYKGGYRFMGWKLDDKQYVTEINSQIRDDITLFAHFEKEYILIFDEKGGTNSNDIAVVQGEEITLPSSSKQYYHGYWKIGVKDYDFSSKYVFNVATAGQIIGGKIEVDAQWWGNEYFINYIYLGINYPSISYFNYGKKTELTPLRLRVDNTFEGFYTDANFTNKIKYIPADSSELLEEARVSAELDVALYINIYIKWKEFNLSYINHSGEILVTDSGRWNQEYIPLDVIFNTQNGRANFSSFNSIKFVISLDIWEYNDGYQYIFLYDKYDEDDGIVLWDMTIEHGSGEKNTTPHRYTFEVNVPIPNFNTTTCDQRFFLLFGASGKSDDDWYNDNREISIYLSTEQPNHTVDNWVVWP